MTSACEQCKHPSVLKCDACPKYDLGCGGDALDKSPFAAYLFRLTAPQNNSQGDARL